VDPSRIGGPRGVGSAERKRIRKWSVPEKGALSIIHQDQKGIDELEIQLAFPPQLICGRKKRGQMKGRKGRPREELLGIRPGSDNDGTARTLPVLFRLQIERKRLYNSRRERRRGKHVALRHPRAVGEKPLPENGKKSKGDAVWA